MSSGRPAPEKMMSARFSMAVRTICEKVVRATMILTPMMPWVLSRARTSSCRRARRLASMGCCATSGSRMPIMAPAMTPMPPSLATADARPEREIPTPMPPCTMGRRAQRSPIFREGKGTVYLHRHKGAGYHILLTDKPNCPVRKNAAGCQKERRVGRLHAGFRRNNDRITPFPQERHRSESEKFYAKKCRSTRKSPQKSS